MTSLFNREITLNVGGTLIRSRFDEQNRVLPTLKVGFKIEKTLKREPNKAEITITNLKESNRTKIQEKDVPTILLAGYVGATHQIFAGNIEFGQNRLLGRDWISKLQTKDGGKAFRTARINRSFKKPAKATDILRVVGESLGIDLGNLLEKVSSGSIRETLSEWGNGMVLSGKSEQQFDKIARSMGFTWSIQDGALLLLGPNETIGPKAVVLSSGTGMIGAPEPGEKGFVKVKSLIQPDIIPGRQIQVISKTVNGFFRIEKATYTGDTWGSDWSVDIEGKPVT